MKKIIIGIIAHVDSGKTTLSEALLYSTGTIRNFGRVDKGASFLDDNQMERKRGITIYSKQARFHSGETEFTLIDTPGHADFSAEMERALQVLDYAVLLVSAADGIKGQTEILWKLLAEYQIPTFVFFNKMDQPGADRDLLFHSFRNAFTDNLVEFPLSLTAERNGAGANQSTDSLADFYDAAAMCSEEAMEVFLETGCIPDSMMAEMIRSRELFPCFFGSALKITGVQELLQALDRFTVPGDYPEEFGARVYKILRDADGSRLTFLKITGGSLKNKSLLPDGDGASKINQLRIYNGNKYVLQEEVRAGEVCAAAGLRESYAGQGYGSEADTPAPLMVPILNYRVNLHGTEDPVRVLPYFRTLEEETPELTVSWEEDHKEIHVSVMGEVQLEILTTLLKDRFDLDVTFDSGEVMYKETIAKPVVGVGHFEPLRHYAEVHLLMEPLPSGSGLVFDSSVSTDRLARNWQRLILTHLSERRHRGVLTGAPITDMQITLIAGKAHLKHTEGGDFRQAVYRAVRQGLMMTENVLLEPYYRFVLEIPAGSVGRAMNDLNRMQAAFGQPEQKTGGDGSSVSVIRGRGPVSALRAYPGEISAYTKGQGHIILTNDGYDVCRNAEEVIRQKGYDPLADVRNTPDSVFCAHGAGYLVPYDQVYDYMHLSLDGSSENTPDETGRAAEKQADIIRSIGQDEIDAIIASVSRANSRANKSRNNWKRKFGTGDAGVRTGGGVPFAAVSGIPVFAIEDAEYVVVDGYNVIFAWKELADLARTNIDSARDALIDVLSGYQSLISGRVIAVFDAYRVRGHATERMQLQDVQIIYTGEEETADQYIEKFTNEHGRKDRIVVVTSDHLEQIITRGQGCMLISSRDFKAHYERLSGSLREKYNIK